MVQSLKEKLQIRPSTKSLLIINPPEGYLEGIAAFDKIPTKKGYDFIQIFGTSSKELHELYISNYPLLSKGGLFWVSYPKKTSKKFISDCSRERTCELIEGLCPVRQIAIDADWTAMRFKDRSLMDMH